MQLYLLFYLCVFHLNVRTEDTLFKVIKVLLMKTVLKGSLSSTSRSFKNVNITFTFLKLSVPKNWYFFRDHIFFTLYILLSSLPSKINL